jgi:hypothetical protein
MDQDEPSRSEVVVRPLLVCGIAFVLAGCSSPSGPSTAGSGSVQGTLLGKAFTPVDAASLTANGMVTVVLYDASGLCGELTTNGVKPNSSALSFVLPTAASGTYNSVNVQFVEFDATCNSPAGESGSGSVTVTASSASSLSGKFLFMLNSDLIAGSFVAPTCTGVPGTGPKVCK